MCTRSVPGFGPLGEKIQRVHHPPHLYMAVESYFLYFGKILPTG